MLLTAQKKLMMPLTENKKKWFKIQFSTSKASLAKNYLHLGPVLDYLDIPNDKILKIRKFHLQVELAKTPRHNVIRYVL